MALAKLHFLIQSSNPFVSVQLRWVRRALSLWKRRRRWQKSPLDAINLSSWVTECVLSVKMCHWRSVGCLPVIVKTGEDVLSAAGWRFHPQRLLLFLLRCVEAIFMTAVTSQRLSVRALRGGSNKLFFLVLHLIHPLIYVRWSGCGHMVHVVDSFETLLLMWCSGGAFASCCFESWLVVEVWLLKLKPVSHMTAAASSPNKVVCIKGSCT